MFLLLDPKLTILPIKACPHYLKHGSPNYILDVILLPGEVKAKNTPSVFYT